MSELNRLTLLKLEPGPDGSAAALRAKAAYSALERDFGKIDSFVQTPAGERLLIVGGGIVGLMSAVFASLQGYRITVVERLSFGAAASGRNAGGILVLGHTLEELSFNRLSLRLWHDLAVLGIESEYRASGHIMLAFSETEATTLAAGSLLYQQAGLDVEYLNPAQIEKRLPDVTNSNFGGLYCRPDAQGYPFRAVKTILKWLKDRGVELLPHTEVTGFTINDSTVKTVQTNRGTLPADMVLLCAGPWSAQLGKMLELPLAIRPRRSQILVTERIADRIVDPFVTGNALYLRQTHAGNLLFGGGGKWESGDFNVANTLPVMTKLVKRFLEVFPSYRDIQLIRAFAGTVDLTPDARPLLGPSERYDNVFVAAGFSGHGFGWSAAAGRLAAAIIAHTRGRSALSNEILAILEPLAPSRHYKNVEQEMRSEGKETP